MLVREREQKPINLREAVDEDVGGGDAPVDEKHDERAQQLRQHIECHLGHKAALGEAPPWRVCAQGSDRLVQDGSSRLEVVTREVERQEVGEGLAPYARAHTIFPEGRVRERVECRIDTVHLVRARVDGERERDAEDLWGGAMAPW